MRKIQHLLLSAAMLLVSLAASAQAKMTIELKNGTSLSFYVSEIEKITWNDGTDSPTGGDNDPGEQNVKGKPIDLGLSVKWANMNVGATKPEEYGDYFAWGETEPKSTYDWSTYKYMEDGYFSWEHVTKYTTEDNQKSGCWYDGDTYVGTTVDGVTYKNKTVLDPEDDAAHVNWGGDWRMPTREEQDELRTKCSWKWTTSGGVNGYVVTGPNGNSIFLPAAGCRSNSGLYNAGSNGFYWSSSLYSGYSDDAYYLYFYSSRVGWSSYDRSYGQSVRAVCP